MAACRAGPFILLWSNARRVHHQYVRLQAIDESGTGMITQERLVSILENPKAAADFPSAVAVSLRAVRLKSATVSAWPRSSSNFVARAPGFKPSSWKEDMIGSYQLSVHLFCTLGSLTHGALVLSRWLPTSRRWAWTSTKARKKTSKTQAVGADGRMPTTSQAVT